MLNNTDLYSKLIEYRVHNIFNFFNKYFDKYYIAGEFICNILFNKPVKEIDIFVNLSTKSLNNIIKDNIYTPVNLSHVDNYTHIGFTVTNQIIKLQYKELTPYTIHIIDLEKEFIVSPHLLTIFDSSLCRIALSNTYELICTEDFLETYYNYVNYTKHNHNQIYLNRLNENYKGIRHEYGDCKSNLVRI